MNDFYLAARFRMVLERARDDGHFVADITFKRFSKNVIMKYGV